VVQPVISRRVAMAFVLVSQMVTVFADRHVHAFARELLTVRFPLF
jgi:hypothetical protein